MIKFFVFFGCSVGEVVLYVLVFVILFALFVSFYFDGAGVYSAIISESDKEFLVVIIKCVEGYLDVLENVLKKMLE